MRPVAGKRRERKIINRMKGRNMVMDKKGQGNIVWPEVIKIVLIMTTVIIVLSIIYMMFKSANTSRGLW